MASFALLAASAATAQTFEVKGEGVRFQPEIVYAHPGDVIAFRKMIPHAVESIDAMWPPGAAPLRTQVGADADYVVTVAGVYLFRCPRHWGARMAGAIVVEGTEDARSIIASYLAQTDTPSLKPAKSLLKRLIMQQSQRGESR